MNRGNRYRAWISMATGAAAATTLLLSSHRASGDPATAEALFREGRKLLTEGKTSAACEKFDASQRQDPSSGTLLNLADCHTKEGKTATAWAEFLTASRMSKNQGDQARSEEAARRAKDLEGNLSYITFKITAPVAGLHVKRDDVTLEDAVLTSQTPIDGGSHIVTASAPGYKSWSKSISVALQKDHVEIVVPPLEKDLSAPVASGSAAPTTAPTTTASAPPPQPASDGSKRTIGYVVGGVGVAVAVVGGIFGLKALSTYKDAENACGGGHSGCPQESADKKSDANTSANIANIAVPLGLVGIGVGTYLIITGGPKPAETTGMTVTPFLGATSGGAALSGRF